MQKTCVGFGGKKCCVSQNKGNKEEVSKGRRNEQIR